MSNASNPAPDQSRFRGARLARRLALVALLAMVLCAALLLWQRSRSGTLGSDGDGEEIYALTMPDADGRPQALAQWRGKHLVVNFWATWCAPCVAEMPDLDRLQTQYAGRNVVVLGVGTEDLTHVRQFRDRLGLHMILLSGGFDAMMLARSLGDTQGVLPYTAHFSPDGRLVHTQVGALEPGQLRQWIDGTR